jgi:uncharacterized protein (TIGR03085 family)
MRLALARRRELCDLFDRLGPSAPTILPGWRSEELLAHLLVRERHPLAAPGILLPPLARLTERAMRGYTTGSWPGRVALLRDGPPLWSPFAFAPVDERANLVEFFVHYEDLARAQPDWQAGQLPEDLSEALWSALRLSARVLYRRSPVSVLLHHSSRPHGADILAKAGARRVTVAGPPGELVLHAFGRTVAQVEFDGTAEDVAALAETPRGV